MCLVKIFFDFSMEKDGQTVKGQFHVNVVENGNNFIFFNNELKQLLKNQRMIRFNFTNFAFFPDQDLKISRKTVGDNNEIVCLVEMRGKNVCPIDVNSANLPYTIEFITPGKDSFNSIYS